MDDTTPIQLPTVKIPLRFRDLDTLGHVNQSVYHDLFAEAHAGFLRPGSHGPVPATIARVVVDHRHELRYRDGQVTVETVLTKAADGLSGTLASKILRADGTLCAESTTTYLRGAEPTEPAGETPKDVVAGAKAAGKHVTSVVVPLRHSDLDASGNGTQALHHVAFEESRATMLLELVAQLGAGGYVLAHVDVTHLQPIRLTDAELTAETAIARVGGSSIHCATTLWAGGKLAAETSAVLVAWDLQARGARQLTADERAGFAT